MQVEAQEIRLIKPSLHVREMRWTLTLEDGTPLEITLEEEVLRGAMLPAGTHELEMRFAPASYKQGEAVSRASSILLILLALCAVAGAAFYRRKDGSQG